MQNLVGTMLKLINIGKTSLATASRLLSGDGKKVRCLCGSPRAICDVCKLMSIERLDQYQSNDFLHEALNFSMEKLFALFNCTVLVQLYSVVIIFVPISKLALYCSPTSWGFSGSGIMRGTLFFLFYIH